MAALITIDALPNDMLYEIFGLVFAAEPDKPSWPDLHTWVPPSGTHLALRSVCRRWRDIADWVRLSTASIVVDAARVDDAGAVSARHPAAFKRLSLASSIIGHSKNVSQAAASLINGSADLRRALLFLRLETSCLSSVLPAVTPIASCTSLTRLNLAWEACESEIAVPSNMLAPLSALQMLESLVYGYVPIGQDLRPSALSAPLPALPDAPRLTFVCIRTAGNSVPAGTDAALGRLRRLVFVHRAPVQELMDAEDPFLLRTAFDAGTWQPSRLTGLKELKYAFRPLRDSPAPMRPSRAGSPAGSEWAPLAGQVTALDVWVESGGFKRPSTGIIAGLGVLTALRSVRIDDHDDSRLRPGWIDPVSIDRVRAPHLSKLNFNCVSTPVNVARFPNLVHLDLRSVSRQPPLNLRSLVARSSLKVLCLVNRFVKSRGGINLAELFVGGGGWPVLEKLWLHKIALEWDATGLDGVPTAAEFAERARQLLPALVRGSIYKHYSSRAVEANPARAEFVAACSEHVVPALRVLLAGGG